MIGEDLEITSSIAEDLQKCNTNSYLKGFATASNKKEQNKFFTKNIVEHREIFHLEISNPMFEPGTIIGIKDEELSYKDFFGEGEEDPFGYCMEKCDEEDVESINLKRVTNFFGLAEKKTSYDVKPIMIIGESIQIEKFSHYNKSKSSNRNFQKKHVTYILRHFLHAMVDQKKVYITTDMFNPPDGNSFDELDIRYIRNIYDSESPDKIISPYVVLCKNEKK